MAIVRWIKKRLHLRKHHGEAVAIHKLGAHLLVDSRKVADVILGIHELLGVKRAARPVRKALGLGKVDARVGLHERAISQLHPVAKEGGGELGIKHRGRNAAHGAVNDLEVLRAGMHDLDDRWVLEQPRDGREVTDGDGVNRRDIVCRGRELDEAEPGAIRALAKELGIDGKHRTGGRALAEALELLIR